MFFLLDEMLVLLGQEPIYSIYIFDAVWQHWSGIFDEETINPNTSHTSQRD